MALDTTTGKGDAEEVRQSGPAPSPETELPAVAAEDLLIERPDLGHDCYTRIVAGDRIPAALLGWPYRPAAMLAAGAAAPRRRASKR